MMFAASDLPRAMQLRRLLLARKPPVDAAQAAHRLDHHRQSRSSTPGCDQAEAAFIKARDLAGSRCDTEARRSHRAPGRSVYKQGEAKRKAGDAAGAVDDFLRVAKVAPGSKIVATAQYDAAAQLINLKQWDRAIACSRLIRHDYPKSELSADVTRKLAVAYSEGNQPGRSGGEFEHIAADAHEDPQAAARGAARVGGPVRQGQ